MEWAKPNEFYAILRCTKTKYANMLMDNGTIMFNTARAWAEMERKDGKGQGDLYEGVYAACGLYDIPSIKEYYNKYGDVESENDGKLVYFKRSSVIDMPAFCFFLLKQSLFNCPAKEGIQKLEATIPGRYFKDFADGLNKDEVMKLKEENRPSVVMIWDIDKFIEMIKVKLISMGVKESEILIQVISYDDKQVPFYCPAKSPKELFLKDKSFEYQTEGRIVINTRDEKLLNTLVRRPIDIGSVKEFSKQSNDYFEKGVLVEMRADIFQCG